MTHIPVITIDGPSGTGKGTVSQLLARKLHWHYLDSGAIYRVLALQALTMHTALEDENALMLLAVDLPLKFVDVEENYRLFLEEEDVTDKIRSEACSKAASVVSAFPKVRDALLARQRAFQLSPGLVTDGRDMGTVIFPWADLKIFLDASPEVRAMRRHKQLQNLGLNASIDAILSELVDRDHRDRTRAVAPLKPAADAILIDSSNLTIAEVIEKIWTVLPKSILGG